jgi:hypothetical protein
MADHNIQILLKDGHAMPELPPASGDMTVGQTVSYSSPHGKARVEFRKGSPFGDMVPDIVEDSEVRILTNEGKFSCRCFITVGWFEGEAPQSGGDHEVKPKP